MGSINWEIYLLILEKFNIGLRYFRKISEKVNVGVEIDLLIIKKFNIKLKLRHLKNLLIVEKINIEIEIEIRRD